MNERDDDRNDEDGFANGEDRPSDQPEAGRHISSAQRSGGIVTLVVLAFLGAIFTPWGRDVASAVGDVLDDVRDQFRGYPGEEVDNFKERVEGLDEVWVGEPTIFDDSFTFFAKNGDLSVATVEGVQLRYVTPHELVQNAPRYAGQPVILVGFVYGQRLLSDDFLEDYAARELLIRDQRGEDFVFVSLGSDQRAARGDIVVLRGLAVAQGIATYEGGGRFATVYFAGQELITADRYFRSPDQRLNNLIAELR